MYINTDEEVWKDIEGYEGLYEISTFGNVRSVDRVIRSTKGHLRKLKSHGIKQLITGQGYFHVRIRKNGNRKTKFIHRLVAETFISNPGNYPIVNHIDGDKGNNHISNLEWVTSQQNAQHALKHNLTSTTKLSKQEVLKIRELYASGEYTHRELANKFNVTPSNVGRIVRRDTWKII
jgi:hypothetical protein